MMRFAWCAPMAAFFAIATPASAQTQKKCFFLTSYNQGYAWNDGVEAGVRKVLKDKCILRQFDLDTKRNPSPTFAEKKALEAKRLIDSWKPDVIIAADDNASKYVIRPYYKDHSIPVVFCGINWSGHEYGYPYTNATGMIEVNAVKPLFDQILLIKKDARKATCLGVDNETDRKLCDRFVKAGAAQGIDVKTSYVLSFANWKKAYIEAQKDDFLLLPTNAGINDWSDKEARKFLLRESRKLSVGVYDWMVPYTMFAMTTAAEEQGEYAGEVALRLFAGARTSDIPVISNRKWKLWANPALAAAAKIPLPQEILRKAEPSK